MAPFTSTRERNLWIAAAAVVGLTWFAFVQMIDTQQSRNARLEAEIAELEKSETMRQVLGEHLFTNFLQSKKKEWSEYISQVSSWELDRYLTSY